MAVSEDRVSEIVRYYLSHGIEETTALYDVNAETVTRYAREYKAKNPSFEPNAMLLKIKEQYSEAELKAIANGGRLTPGMTKVPIIDFEGDIITIGAMGDMHSGSKYFVESWLAEAYNQFAKAGVDMVVNVGDVVEGMSHRAGHIYELDYIGYEQQKAYAIAQLSQWDGPQYFIDGNHDRWYVKAGNAGALIVPDICEHVPNATFLGHDEGNIAVNGIVIKLWHGEDGSSYATSYRIQKLTEAFSPGEKPNVLFAGHVHKQGYFFDRAIHCISTGSMCRQSNWMRSTRKANHAGFHIVKVCINKSGVAWCEVRWFPFYS
jgi:predicted phosphodiesterase